MCNPAIRFRKDVIFVTGWNHEKGTNRLWKNFKQIDPAEITDNFIRAIGREWMLITAGNGESCNAMTASWGMIGFIWGRPVAQFVIRPQRYTREFVDREERVTLSIFLT